MAIQAPLPAAAPSPADKSTSDRALNAALERTFPASDPIAIGRTERFAPEGRHIDRLPTPIDRALVDRLAGQVRAGHR